MGSTTDWVEDRELIAVLSKVGGVDFGVGTGPEERPEPLGVKRGQSPWGCSIAVTLSEVSSAQNTLGQYLWQDGAARGRI